MKRILRSVPVQHCIAWVLALYVRLVMISQNWRIAGDENLRLLAGDTPFIAVYWHETLPSIPILLRRARAAGMTRQAMGLASRHRDGRLVAYVLQNLGLEQVAGSTSKGGAAGLRGLAQAIEAGKHVTLTPDGPRGPRRIAAPGVAQLASLTGARVLPCGVHISRAITLKSWDRMRLPLPFGHGVLVVGAPIAVPRDDWQPALAAIGAALNSVQEQAEA